MNLLTEINCQVKAQPNERFRMIKRLTPWAYPVIFQWLRSPWEGYEKTLQDQWLKLFQKNQLFWIEIKYDSESSEDLIEVIFKENNAEPEERLRLHVEGIIEKLNA